MAVDVSTSKDGVFKAGVPHKLFPSSVLLTSQRNSWDVTPDGQRFLLNSFGQTGTGSTPITVVVNWLARGQAAKP